MKHKILIISAKNNYVRGKLFTESIKKKYSLSFVQYSGNFFLKNLKLFSILFLKYDLIFICWPLWSSIFIIKLINLFKKKPIIYDAFTLSHEDYLDNYKTQNFIFKKFYEFIDKFVLISCDGLITDTEQHKNKILEIVKNKTKTDVIEVCQKNYKVFNKINKNSKLNILHAGANRRCHNIPKMVNLINELPKEIKQKIIFKIVTDDYFNNYKNLIKNLNCNKYIQIINHLKFNQYLKIIKNCDLCLGTFGKSDKSNNIISNFIVTSLNFGKVVVTSDTRAAKYYLNNNKGVILLKNPQNLNFKKFLMKYLISISFRKSLNGKSKKIFNKNFRALKNLKKLDKLIRNYLE